jgi:hypothetical protein
MAFASSGFRNATVGAALSFAALVCESRCVLVRVFHAVAVQVDTTDQFLPWSASLGALNSVAGLLDSARSPLGAALRRNVTAPLVAQHLDRFWAGVNGSSQTYTDRKNVEVGCVQAPRVYV